MPVIGQQAVTANPHRGFLERLLHERLECRIVVMFLKEPLPTHPRLST
jgi:hypothetical protein